SDLSCTVALSRFRGFSLLFFFTPPATTEIYPLSLHDALPILVDRLMYSLAARDPSRYPLPWGGETPSETRPEPAFMAFLSEEELDALHGAMTARNRLLGLARKLPIASLAYSALIEHGALRRLLDLDLTVEQRTEAIAELRSAVEALQSIEDVHERLHGAKPLLSDITGFLETLLASAADDTA